MSLVAGIFFGGIGGAHLDFGGETSDSSSINGVVAFVAVRVLVDRSGMSFLRGGSGRVLREGEGEEGGCHRWGTALIGPLPVPFTEPIFGPSTSTTQSFRSSRLVFHPRLGGEGEGECASLPLRECTLFNGLGLGDGEMVERLSAVGEIGSSRMIVASGGEPASLTMSPKSFEIFDFDWPSFWSLRDSKADILDWMDVEGDMINYVSVQSCPRQPQKSCTPLQVMHIRCIPNTLRTLMQFADFCLVPIGTGPDSSVRRRETIREAHPTYCRHRSRNTSRNVSVCLKNPD